MKPQPKHGSLVPLAIIAIIACLPIALSALGAVFSTVLECVGEIANVHCKVQAANSPVSTLVSMAWLSIVSVPLGIVAAFVWAVGTAMSTRKRHD